MDAESFFSEETASEIQRMLLAGELPFVGLGVGKECSEIVHPDYHRIRAKDWIGPWVWSVSREPLKASSILFFNAKGRCFWVHKLPFPETARDANFTVEGPLIKQIFVVKT